MVEHARSARQSIPYVVATSLVLYSFHLITRLTSFVAKKSPGSGTSANPTTDGNSNSATSDVAPHSAGMNGHNEKIVNTETPPRDPMMDVSKIPNGVRSESYSMGYNETQITRRK